jgi:hypothetical protein
MRPVSVHCDRQYRPAQRPTPTTLQRETAGTEGQKRGGQTLYWYVASSGGAALPDIAHALRAGH